MPTTATDRLKKTDCGNDSGASGANSVASGANTVTNGAASENGSALVEFIFFSVVVLIPVFYFVLTMGQLQAASFAATGAADQAAKVISRSGPVSQARTQQILHDALADFGMPVQGSALTVSCSSATCDAPGSIVTVTTTVTVPLPLLPGFLEARASTVSSSSSQSVGKFG